MENNYRQYRSTERTFESPTKSWKQEKRYGSNLQTGSGHSLGRNSHNNQSYHDNTTSSPRRESESPNPRPYYNRAQNHSIPSSPKVSNNNYGESYPPNHSIPSSPKVSYNYGESSPEHTYHSPRNSTVPVKKNRDFEVYPCYQEVAPRGNVDGHILHDKFFIRNLDITRRVRDSLTITLQEYVRTRISHREQFRFKIFGNGGEYSWEYVTTPTEFEKCDMRNDLSSLLNFAKKRVKNDKNVINCMSEICEDRNGNSHGGHIDSTKGRNSGGVKKLFENVDIILKALKIDDPWINQLLETWEHQKEILAQTKAVSVQNLTKDQARKILQMIYDNLDDEDVMKFVSGTIAPRIKNVRGLI